MVQRQRPQEHIDSSEVNTEIGPQSDSSGQVQLPPPLNANRLHIVAEPIADRSSAANQLKGMCVYFMPINARFSIILKTGHVLLTMFWAEDHDQQIVQLC